MASTVFQDYNQNNPIVAAWLNDINGGVYTPGGVPKKAIQSSAVWVRFSITAGVVAIQQSSNVATVVRTAAGIYVVTFAAALINSANCYEMSMSQAGFAFVTAESGNSITIHTTDTTNTAFDPTFVSLVVYGAN